MRLHYFLVPVAALTGCQASDKSAAHVNSLASQTNSLKTPSQTAVVADFAPVDTDNSLLQFHPGAGTTPSAQVLVSTFGDEDVTAVSSDGQYNYDKQSSFQQTMSQGSEAIKVQLRHDFAAAFPPNLTPNHPACVTPSNPNLFIYSYLKPYIYSQANILGWLHSHSPNADILPPLARKTNSYLGNQLCPLGASDATINQTFGYAALATTDQIALYIDNGKNPWRWNAPINTIHPVEQPSFAAISNVANSTVGAQTQTILANFLSGNDRSTHILLDYSVNFTVLDERSDLGENSIWDMYGGVAPQGATTLLGLTHLFAYLYGQLNGVYAYATQRLIPPSVELSLMVNFRADQQAWIENEFMLSSFNYATTVPNASANPTINNYIFEGGTNSTASWYRLRADALNLPGLITNAPANPILVRGGGYTPVTFQNNQFQTTLWGTIDLTNYYLVSNQNQFFPGQTKNFDAQFGQMNGINWAGVIVENHGPFATSVNINTFNIRTSRAQ